MTPKTMPSQSSIQPGKYAGDFYPRRVKTKTAAKPSRRF
jgi:hypothetical protein